MELQAPELFRQQAFIDGIWCEADQGRRTDIFNPATGDKLGSVPDMGAEETRRAIEAAQAAQPAWRKRTAKERAAILRRWFELIMLHQEDLAKIMTAEQGKPLAEARGRSPTRPPSSNGSPRKPNGSTAISSRGIRVTSASWCRRNLSV